MPRTVIEWKGAPEGSDTARDEVEAEVPKQPVPATATKTVRSKDPRIVAFTLTLVGLSGLAQILEELAALRDGDLCAGLCLLLRLGLCRRLRLLSHAERVARCLEA